MAVGFSARAMALRLRRLVQAPAPGRLDFSSTAAGALAAIINEDC